MTEIIKINPTSPEPALIERAAEYIKQGKLVAFPTETVYGLGADAFNADAALNVFKAKNRPPDNPLIVHISSMQQLGMVAIGIPANLEKLAEKVWPGPITFILKKSERVPYAVTGNMDTVAVRMPAHPIALALIEKSGPIAAPSANLSTKPSPTTASHVINDLNGRIDAIIDGGNAFFGVESTIISLIGKPVLLRPGPFTVEELESLFGKVTIPEEVRIASQSEKALAPGMKYRHYAPDTPLFVVYNCMEEVVKELDMLHISYSIICSNETAAELGKTSHAILLGSRSNMYEIAKNLFSALRSIDDLKSKFCLIEAFDERGIGLAVMNRIKKASSLSGIYSKAGIDAIFSSIGSTPA